MNVHLNEAEPYLLGSYARDEDGLLDRGALKKQGHPSDPFKEI